MSYGSETICEKCKNPFFAEANKELCNRCAEVPYHPWHAPPVMLY